MIFFENQLLLIVCNNHVEGAPIFQENFLAIKQLGRPFLRDKLLKIEILDSFFHHLTAKIA